MRTEQEQRKDLLKDAKTFFEEGLISPETLDRVNRSLEVQNGELDAFIDRTRKAADITADMRTETQQQADALRDAKGLLDEGLIDPGTFKRFAQSIDTDAREFVSALGRGLHDTFVDWFTGIDVSFRDLLKRMAAEAAVSGLFKMLGTAFGGPATFFGSLFGGFRANGGPLERGPEPVWGGGAGAFAYAGGGMGGGGVNITNHIDARGADPSIIQRLPKILEDNRKQTVYEVSQLMKRNRLLG